VYADRVSTWNGWSAQRQGIPAQADRWLRRELGVGSELTPSVSLDEVRLRPGALPAAVRAELGAVAQVREDRAARVAHSGGKSYKDLIRRRTGDAEDAPDAVVLPDSHDSVRSVLRICADAGVAVVPYGGGTSVVGGVEPIRAGFPALISLDLCRLDRMTGVDAESLLATFEPGLLTPRAESLLAEHGLTLGHFPQSFEQASIGGYVATRSAGQASTGYGRIDELVQAVRVATPAGDLVLGRPPASAAGPDLRQLLVGSEGSLGIIMSVTLRVHRRPQRRRYEAFVFHDFGEGLRAFRRLAQERVAADVCRLSDEDETRANLILSGTSPVAAAYLRLRGYGRGCLAILGWEGEPGEVTRRHRATARVLKQEGALALGAKPGAAWERHRYSGPYLRDDLLDRGVLVDTLETAAPWSRIRSVHTAVADALRGALRQPGGAGGPYVMCHVSHLYETGASLYYTFMAKAQRGREVDQWEAAKVAASDALVAAGATITHHHAVGSEHAAWMPAEVGELGLDVLRAVKSRLDPAGVLNPGKLVLP
jgi:alkyldihydroxyacetonephosphate synthase